MNAVIKEIYNDWCTVIGKENISFTLAMKAESLLCELDYYPSYIWNTEGKIVFEFTNRFPRKNLYIFVDEKFVTGKICDGKYLLEEFVYMNVDNINTVLDRFWE